ncbi:hypothetical protein CLHUN_01080 [Ruminiclostridium hungatei]|uniref:FG-GAP repeat protein n=1 Tax=Ruminiclostridium hungatei TaxID=48256 RepID=A0A1V4SR06_RUMHU|nr:hypothetical protein [Ruminiclostridium hungatei]OPX46292.1 hypothetical protein CLHUN_01080 [Ruminiclostridium hungatei]
MSKKYGKHNSLKLVLLLFAMAFTMSACSVDNNYALDKTQPPAAHTPAAKSTAPGTTAEEESLDTQAGSMSMEEAVQIIREAGNTEVIKTWEQYESAKIPLIAALPERNLYLYGLKDKVGVILYYNGAGHFYEWNYLTPRFILPGLKITDFDGDGKEELGVILYVGSGTGLSVEELHMVKISETEVVSDNPKDKNYLVPNKEYFKDYCYSDYSEQLKEQVKLKTHVEGAALWADVTAGQKASSFELENPTDDIDNENIVFGNIVRFEFKDKKITAQFALGAIRKSYASPDFIGELNTEVVFKAGNFKLENITFQQ